MGARYFLAKADPMRASSRPQTIILTTCLLAVVAGCGESPAPTVAAVGAAAPQQDEPATTQAEKQSPPAKAANQPISQKSPAELAYQPPFPNRVNLFEPLRKKRTSTAQRSDTSGESVVLKGFGNVGQPMAILAIDGVIAPLSEGEERYGVEVISINQPKAVVLQRGRSRWTATLQ